ncbi:unnamed protein product [Mytilus edulis]|uniref:Uncharacterized protein n=1 Tax=Mytilus edulis TaxID=6550 RepID=A0A8S3QFH2_MYTED|nr:unnamed protein product [Mytilus edulis]
MPTEQDLYNVIDSNEPWKGRMLFTGPDATKDHLMTVNQEHRQVGIGTMSREGTSETDYLWRPATGTPFHRPRTSKVGEVGWGIPNSTDWKVSRTGKQIMLGEFRQACEDRHSHLYQNAWFPGPRDEIPESTDAALIMNVYRPKTTEQHHTGSYWSTRRNRRTPSATRITSFYTTPTAMHTTNTYSTRIPSASRTTNFYSHHNYYKRSHYQEGTTSCGMEL